MTLKELTEKWKNASKEEVQFKLHEQFKKMIEDARANRKV